MVSRFQQNETLDITLHLEKDGYVIYKLSQMEALLSNHILDEQKHSLLDANYNLHVNHAICLLKGGAVLIDTNGTNSMEEKWLQLDMNHIDCAGTAPLRELIVEEPFRLEQVLKDTASNINYPGLYGPEVLAVLAKGAQAAFRLEHKRLFYLEADPRHRALKFRNESQQTIPMELIRDKIMAGKLRQPKINLPEKKVGLSKGRDKGKGMGI